MSNAVSTELSLKSEHSSDPQNKWTWVGVGALIIAWWGLSEWSGPLLLASPIETMRTLFDLALRGDLRAHLGITFMRILVIMCLSLLAGGIMGCLAIIDKRAAGLFEPWRRTFSTIPPIVLAVVVMFWAGMGSQMIVIFGALILWPVMYVNIVESSANYSRELQETAQAFGLSAWTRIRHFFIPAIMPGCLTAAVQMICNAIRIVVLAEALGAEKGIGAAIVTSSRNLAIDQMTAWAAVALALAFLAESTLLGPLRRKVYRWKMP